MTHDEVKDTGALAKYLQGGLPEKEREEFEEHLFECPQCSRMIKSDLILKMRGEVARNRHLAKREEEDKNGPLWQRNLMSGRVAYPRGIAAAALLAVGLSLFLVVYQTFVVIPGLNQKIERLLEPRPLTFLPIARAVRSEGPGDDFIKLPQDCLQVGLWLQLSAEEDFPAYLSEFVGESGASFEVEHAAPADFMLRLIVSCSDLPPGNYTLNLYGIQEEERIWINRTRFEIRLE